VYVPEPPHASQASNRLSRMRRPPRIGWGYLRFKFLLAANKFWERAGHDRDTSEDLTTPPPAFSPSAQSKPCFHFHMFLGKGKRKATLDVGDKCGQASFENDALDLLLGPAVPGW
jgi:hypothetical protein